MTEFDQGNAAEWSSPEEYRTAWGAAFTQLVWQGQTEESRAQYARLAGEVDRVATESWSAGEILSQNEIWQRVERLAILDPQSEGDDQTDLEDFVEPPFDDDSDSNSVAVTDDHGDLAGLDSDEAYDRHVAWLHQRAREARVQQRSDPRAAWSEGDRVETPSGFGTVMFGFNANAEESQNGPAWYFQVAKDNGGTGLFDSTVVEPSRETAIERARRVIHEAQQQFDDRTEDADEDDGTARWTAYFEHQDEAIDEQSRNEPTHER